MTREEALETEAKRIVNLLLRNGLLVERMIYPSGAEEAVKVLHGRLVELERAAEQRGREACCGLESCPIHGARPQPRARATEGEGGPGR